MSYGFEKGRSYNRRQDIHARFGGSQQSGIIPAPAHNVIFIMSGARGPEYGYDDEVLEDGTVLYFGEGQRGHQQYIRGNRAIGDHAADGRSLLLFHKRYPQRDIIFVGEMVCESFEWRQGRDADGAMRQVIVFHLRHIDSIVEQVEATAPILDDLGALRALAYAAAGVREPMTGNKPRTIYERSADVRNYVLARARGTCEGCGAPAPFVRRDGSHYLEPHHIRRVSDGGPDHPAFVIGLCPNCHRRVHAGIDGASYNTSLLARMPAIETKL
ncbi:HNH endonuclease [Devosia aurantiaca]|uniref:HNH endonuclease n=1 Tax=Devosia aurantiaca TaxID=2714858 RepID=A0A6M1SPL5_9HYPH|nr:HNH endonuclease signature motif containing protein [Devosia aurantiaca]NGP19158.1 HNH endonuclease [Devosia aurantiaca]